MNRICSHFSYSAIRRAKLAKIQRILKRETILEILTYTPVRWLSYCNALSRIIELWDPLKEYFRKYGDQKDQEQMSKENELCLRLLLILLSKLTYYTGNKKFQTSHLYYKDVIKHLKQSFIVFAQLILHKEKRNLSFEDLFQLPWSNDESEEMVLYLSTSDEFMENIINDHSSIKGLVEGIGSEYQGITFGHCKSFILKALFVMKEKCTINEPIIKTSKAAFLTDNQFEKDDWVILSKQFTNLIPSNEQHLLLAETDRFRIEYLQNQADAKYRTPAALWNYFQDDYPYMTRIAKAVMVLPQSSVSIERVFAQLKSLKNERRSRLNAENLRASLLLFQKHDDGNFEITNKMLDSYGSLGKKPIKKNVVRKSQSLDPNSMIEEVKTNSQLTSKENNDSFPSPFFENQTFAETLQDPNLKQQLQLLMNNALTSFLFSGLRSTETASISKHSLTLFNYL